jgi:glutathione S-transferase
MSITKPTLTYFHFPGRAEVPRLILIDAGVDYDFNTFTDWHATRQSLTEAGKLLFGQVPLYEEPGGLSLVQSNAIARYLARKHGYNGSNEQEAIKIDVVNEGVKDFFNKFVELKFDTDKSKKAEARAAAVRDYLPVWLNYFEAILNKNGTGFLVGDKISYADFHLFHALRNWSSMIEGAADVINNHPLNQFVDNILNRPPVKAHYDTNPYARK